MSNEIEAIKDPGLPAHVHRKADHDPVAAKRAERQVAILFGISSHRRRIRHQCHASRSGNAHLRRIFLAGGTRQNCHARYEPPTP